MDWLAGLGHWFALRPWGDIGTWVGGLGTVGAFVVAFKQIGQERSARQKAEQAQLEAAKRAQAELVGAWMPGADVSDLPDGTFAWAVILRNASQLPVSYAIVGVGGSSRATGEPFTLRGLAYNIPPGTWKFYVFGKEGKPQGPPTVEVAFTDSAGHHWRRPPNGALEELATAPPEHYGIPRDVATLVQPKPVTELS